MTTERLTVEDFLQMAKQVPVVDVRTPAEFFQGHIPGATNLPLFTNDERAAVGTVYVQQGSLPAQLLGLVYVGSRLRELGEKLLSVAGGTGKPLLIHCWRGGMRSSSVAWLAGTLGIQAFTLDGGYKSFRRWVIDSSWVRHDLQIVAGFTGSGKTEILKALAALGESIIDIEALANHKGSAFGFLGEEQQPTQEHFENRVALACASASSARAIWVEDESRNTGRCFLATPFWQAKQAGTFHVVQVPLEERVRHLCNVYGQYSAADLLRCVNTIAKRLGGDRLTTVVDAIERGDLTEACKGILAYYDRAYGRALDDIPADRKVLHTFDSLDSSIIAQALTSHLTLRT